MTQRAFFLTGIDTEIGKTVASAILTEALCADYWKPVQCGELSFSDSKKIKTWVRNERTTVHSESHRLQAPMSPHAAAAAEGKQLKLSDFQLPAYHNDYLIAEGAGGLYVPLNDEDCIIDLIGQLQLPVILVSKNYLGSINHTLLSIHALRQRNIPIAGLLFNGPATPTTESIIELQTQVPVIGRLPWLAEITPDAISEAAEAFRPSLLKVLGL
ncbi:MAG: dethiobiotin synthase [Bacteroidota bacterium]